MVLPNLDPDYAFAKDLQDLKNRVAVLETQDVLQNSSVGSNGIHVTDGSVSITGGGSLYIDNNDIAALTFSAPSNISNVDTTVAAGNWSTTNRPSTTVTTGTGKLMITVNVNLKTNSPNGGYGGATFSIPGYVDRAVQLDGWINSPYSFGLYNGAICQSWYYLDGIFSSSYVQVVTGLPKNTPITVTFELYCRNGSVTYRHASVIAQVVA